LQRSRVALLAQPPAVDLDFTKRNEYGNTITTAIKRLTPYTSVTIGNSTTYSANMSGPGFINSNGLVQLMTSSATTVPRFEYLNNPIEGAANPVRSLGLNLDGLNYNYLENSRTMVPLIGTYKWTQTNVTGAGTLNAIGPDGNTSAITLTATAANGVLHQPRGTSGITPGSKTFSVWLKRKTGTGTIQIRQGAVNYETVAVTSEWKRFKRAETATPSPGIRIVNSGDEIYVFCPQLSSSTNSVFTSPNELIGDVQPLQSDPDSLDISLGSSNVGASPITGEVGTIFLEIDMTDRGGLSQVTYGVFNVTDGIDNNWYFEILRNPLAPGNDSVDFYQTSAFGLEYQYQFLFGTLTDKLRLAISWDTTDASGTFNIAYWADTALTGTDTRSAAAITSLNLGDPSATLNGRVFYVTKFKVWDGYKTTSELQTIVSNG
jgi:hypothetical protein